jgi:SAM-dependent methyltransferase
MYVKKYYNDNPNNSFDISKYLNLDIWVLETLGRIFKLRLHRKRNLRILDISTGMGYFPFVCNYLGHQAECTDMDDNDVYNQATKKLKLKRYIKRIEKFTPLKLNKKYDLVTSFMICFNEHKQPGVWHIDEWDFFFNDINSILNENGLLYLSLNIEDEIEPIDNGLLDYFNKKGARIDGTNIYLTKSCLNREV